jgi:DNA-binding CsgD family transcriptional regulator
MKAAQAARAAPPGPEPPRAVDALLDAFAARFAHGYAAAAPTLTRALRRVLALDTSTDEAGGWLWLAGPGAGGMVALELWDDASWYDLARRQPQVARDTGALVHLQSALDFLARAHILAGELSTAARLIEEHRLVAEATGNPAVAWRGQEAEASQLIQATVQNATERGLGRPLNFGAYARSVLCNGLGHHERAREAALRAFEQDQLGYGPFVVPELAEAASRTGDAALVRAALEWLSERTRLMPTEWVLGIEARVRALLSEGDTADRLYRESVDRLGRTRLRAELARSRLLYGEWLRRERRRGDARVQLRTAHDMLDAMGIEAFAERARRELAATGEAARKRSVETSTELTAQEAQVARLAREGLSNPEIGARLFISSRTVQYHLKKVFAKLGISSRSQLDRALPDDPPRP